MAPLALEAIPAVLAGALMGILGIVLLRVDARAPANRAFSAFLLLFGAAVTTSALARLLAGDPARLDSVIAWRYSYPYFFVPAIPALVRFASVYPRRRGPFGGRAGLVALAAATIALEAVYLLDHRVFAVYAVRAGAATVVEAGPLVALPLTMTMALAGLVFAVDVAREPDGPRRRSLLLVALALALTAVFNSASNLGGQSILTVRDAGGWGVVDWYVVTLAGLPAAAAVAILAARSTGRARTGVLAAGAATVLGALAPLVVPSLVFVVLVTGVVRLLVPVLVAYALLKHRLLDIDLKIKWTVKQSTVAAAFIAVFFVVSESASAFFAGRAGTYIGIAAAGLLVFAIAPLQRLAERVADRAMPGVAPSADYLTYRKCEIYKVAVEGALKDGRVSVDERETLDRLREKLELSAEAADAIERDLRPRPVAA